MIGLATALLPWRRACPVASYQGRDALPHSHDLDEGSAMNHSTLLLMTGLAAIALTGTACVRQGEPRPPPPDVSASVVVNERDIAQPQPGPHEGEGTTTAYPFFADATGFDLIFRKRAMHKGSTIGWHVNDKDEIYYVLSGRGELTLNDRKREVSPGDAILTRNGDSHALRQLGEEDLVLFIVYRKPPR